MVAAARLPGVQFEVVSPPGADTLVRMDIACFAGFAASGPLHVPVAVEDIAHFAEVFGNDLALATDAKTNQPVNAYLASAVRAFFRNGGQRCWVIRVAEEKSAETGLFPLPGLYRLESGVLTQAFVPARSPGNWSDALFAGLTLRSHSVVVTDIAPSLDTVGLALSSAGEVDKGDLLRFTFSDTGDVYWLFVDQVEPRAAMSPPSSQRGRLVAASGSRSYWQKLSSPPSPGALPICERITMDLFVQGDEGNTWSLTELGFAPLHPRYLEKLPDDATLYVMDTTPGLAAEAAHPRFPLAGRLHDNRAAAAFYIPAGTQDSLASPLAQEESIPGFFPLTRPVHSGARELERNGLKDFGPHLFLDDSLAEVSAADLLNEAFYIEYQSPNPRKLRGIHAAIDIEEATLIGAPDAVQRRWFPVDEEKMPGPQPSSPLQHPEWWHFADCRQPVEVPRVLQPPAGQFQPCDLRIVPAPGLTLIDLGGGSYELSWLPLPGEGMVDYLEEAVDPGFLTAAVKRQTNSGSVTIYGQPPGDYYYRVRRQAGAVTSDYSNGVAIRIQTAGGYRQEPVGNYQDDTLLSVQQALVALSAARGDMFAVLSLPGHYREREAVAHAAELKAQMADQPATLSFCGIYHPWLTGREENDLDNLRTTPPEGAVAGVMAKRSADRGAWISPANENLSGVVALSPVVRREYRQLLQDSQVNLVRQEPGGFVCLSEATLSDDDDLLPINVRRLLSFLRKTVLLVGNQYVFEPLSDEFRRAVERGFQRLLADLHQRGALAGRTAREAYQVSTSGGLNTAAAADQGRFYVELKIAPSLPLRFLTVRLLQTADRMFVTEGQ